MGVVTQPVDWGRFQPEVLAVGASKYWILSVRPTQITLGSCVILARRNVYQLSELTKREIYDLLGVFQAFERLLADCFGPDNFNYVVSGQHDPLLHLHAFPRYERDVVWRERDWVDHRWPNFLTFPEQDANPLIELRSLAEFLSERAQEMRLLERYDPRKH